jgi:hypothetical protein
MNIVREYGLGWLAFKVSRRGPEAEIVVTADGSIFELGQKVISACIASDQ